MLTGTFGEFAQGVLRVLEARPFRYRMAGDIQGHSSAMSLVFTNTNSIGSQLPISDKAPHDPYLELAFYSAWTRTNIVKRVIGSALPAKIGLIGLGQNVQVPQPSGHHHAAAADLRGQRAARPPATITAHALKIIVAAISGSGLNRSAEGL